MVTVQDAFGRAVQLPRDQWKKEVLPQLVDAFVHDPARLAAMLVQHLRDGLGADLLPAALRLAAVDTELERALPLLAAVQREAGETDGCEATLRELLQRRPQSPAARVGLATMRAATDRDGSIALLREALAIEPNHGDALHGLLQLEHARGGDAAVAAALDAQCDAPAAWRPFLWRARRSLQQQQPDAAVADLRVALDRGGAESDALLMAATDLAQAGRHDLVAELVLPRYRLERHHPHVGLHVLGVLVRQQRTAEGQQLLHELRVRFPRMLDQHLAAFDAELTRQALARTPTAPAAAPKVTMYRIDRPLWFAALGEPEFLLPRPRAGKRVLFTTLAVPAADGGTAPAPAPAPQREDEVGRLTRSVPFFLAEQLWLGAAVPASVALPVVEGGGWVVSGVPWQEESLLRLLDERQRQETVLVTGALRQEGSLRRIELWLCDGARGERIGSVAAAGEAGQLGGALLQLRRELATMLGADANALPTVGSETFQDHHAAGLGKLAALVVAQIGAVPKERVYGQRAILEWLLAVALEEPRWTPSKLALATAICADAAIGSPIHRELAHPFAELFRVEPKESAFAKVAVLPLRRLGLDHLWQHRRAEIVAGTDARYAQWLQRAES